MALKWNYYGTSENWPVFRNALVIAFLYRIIAFGQDKGSQVRVSCTYKIKVGQLLPEIYLISLPGWRLISMEILTRHRDARCPPCIRATRNYHWYYMSHFFVISATFVNKNNVWYHVFFPWQIVFSSWKL